MRTILILSLVNCGLFAQNPESATSISVDTTSTGPVSIGTSQLAPQPFGPKVRQIASLHNAMPHKVTGIGLVTGLNKTGASDRVTRQMIRNFIQQHGLQVTESDITSSSTALVSLTAELPPFTKEGSRAQVQAQVLGDAISLRGGSLLLSSLFGVDGLEYVVAQGSIDPNGLAVEGKNAEIQVGLPTIGSITSGGTVIRDVPTSYFSDAGAIEYRLHQPSNAVAVGLTDAIRKAVSNSPIWSQLRLTVSTVDKSLVRIEMPMELQTAANAAALLALIEDLTIAVQNPASITIDRSTGVVAAGEGIYISPCVVCLTGITISVTEDQEVSQPNPFSQGESTTVNRTRIDVESRDTPPRPVQGGASVMDLLQNLKALGLSTQQLISVFLTLKKEGYLHADVVVR
jgi:flagellar P-ring protein precursor FlgI